MNNPFEILSSQIANCQSMLIDIKLGRGLTQTTNEQVPPSFDYVPVTKSEEVIFMNKSSLYRYEKEGLINLYKFGGKTYFKKSQIVKVLEENKM